MIFTITERDKTRAIAAMSEDACSVTHRCIVGQSIQRELAKGYYCQVGTGTVYIVDNTEALKRLVVELPLDHKAYAARLNFDARNFDLIRVGTRMRFNIPSRALKREQGADNSTGKAQINNKHETKCHLGNHAICDTRVCRTP